MYCNPYLGGMGWIIDIMRRREDAPHGVMELLFHDIMQTLKAENVQCRGEPWNRTVFQYKRRAGSFAF